MSGNDEHFGDLERLAQLRDRGIITPQEYDTEKQQVLDKINGPAVDAQELAPKTPERTTSAFEDLEPQPVVATNKIAGLEPKHIAAKAEQTSGRKNAWYTRPKGMLFALFTLPYFALYWLLTRRDTSEDWYTRRWGAAAAVIFAPFFSIWYVWAKKSWGMGSKLAFILPMAFFIVIFSIAFATAEPATTKKAAETPKVAEIQAVAKPVTAVPKATLSAVTKIVDGDTIHATVDGKSEKIRFIGVDTPEPDKGQCYSDESTAKVREYLNAKNVRLEADPSQADRDQFGRLLRYVYLEDGTFINRELVALGFARELTVGKAYQYQADFIKAQADAKAGAKGLWASSTCNGTTVKVAAPSTQPAALATPVATPRPAPAPAPTPTPPSGGSVYFANCAAAKAAGAAPLRTGDPGYRLEMDGDEDGVACER